MIHICLTAHAAAVVLPYLLVQVYFVERLVSWCYSSYDTVAVVLSLTQWQGEDSLREEVMRNAS